MPKYRIEELSFIDNMLVQPGTEIESDSDPADHWTPLDDSANKAATKAATKAKAKAAAVAAEGNAGENPAALPAAPAQEVAELA